MLPPRTRARSAHAHGAPAEPRALGRATLTNPCPGSLSRCRAACPHAPGAASPGAARVPCHLCPRGTGEERNSTRAEGQDSARGVGTAGERFCSKELPSAGKITKGVMSRKRQTKTVSLQPQ